MSEYTPDSWVPVIIESEKHGKIYKILAGWYGGYTGADAWKLSSGTESISVSEDGTVLTIPQSSGSTYIVGKRTHMTMLMGAKLAEFEKHAEESKLFTIKAIEVDEFLKAFNQ